MRIKDFLVKNIGVGDMNLVLIGDIIGRGFSFIVSILIMKLANPYEMGLFSFFLSVLSFGVPLSDLGLNNTMVKYVSSKVDNDKEIAWKYLRAAFELKTAVAFSVMILIILLADLIATSAFSKPETSNILRLSSVAIVGGTYREFYACTLQAYQLFKKLTLFRVTASLLKLILVFLVINAFGFDLMGIIIIFLVLPYLIVIEGLYLFPPSFLKCKLKRREVYGKLFRFGKWVALSTISAVIMLQLDIFMLSSMMEMEDVGIYGAAYRLCLPFFALVGSITLVLYPKAMKLSTKSEYISYIKRVITFTFPIAAIMVPVVLFGSDFIFSYFPQYDGSAPILRVLIVGFAIILVTNPISLILYALDMPKLVAIINVIQLIANVIGNWILISRYGPLGAAISTVGVWVIGAIAFSAFSLEAAKGRLMRWGKIS